MPLILFAKSTQLFEFKFEEGVAYEVQDRLALKFCTKMGIAAEVSEAENVQPNPMADYVFPEPRVRAKNRKERKRVRYTGSSQVVGQEAAPVAVPAAEPVVEDEVEAEAPVVTGTYEIVGKGGPWFTVVNTDTGEEVSEKPLRKSDAIEMMEGLNGGADAPADDTD